MNRHVSLKNLTPVFFAFISFFLFLNSFISAQVLVQADDPQAVTGPKADIFGDQEQFESFTSDLERVKAEADAIVIKIKQLKERDELVIELQDKLKASLDKEKELVYKLVEANKDIIHLKRQMALFEKDLSLLKKESQLKDKLFVSEKAEKLKALKEKEGLLLEIKGARENTDTATSQFYEVKGEVDSLNKEMDFLKRDLQLKSKQLDRSKQLLQAKDTAISRFNMDQARSSSKEREAILKLTQAQYDIEALKANIASLKKDIEIRDKEILAGKKLLSQEQALVFSLENKLTSLSRKDRDISFERKQYTQEIESLRKDITILKKNLKAKDAQLKKHAKILGEKATFSSQLKEANQEIDSLNDTIAFLNNEIVSRDKQVKDARRMLRESQARTGELKVSFEDSLRKERSFAERLAKSEKKVSALKNETHSLNQQILKKEQKLADALMTAKENETLSSRIGIASKKEQQLSFELARAKERISLLEKKIETKDELLAQQQKEDVAFLEERSYIRKEVAAKNKELAKALADNRNLKVQILDNQKMIAQYRKDKADFLEEKKTIRSRTRASSQKESDLLLELTARIQEMELLKKDMEAKDRQLKQAKGALENRVVFGSDLKQAESKLEAMSKDVTGLNNEISIKDRRLKEAREGLSEAQAQVKEMQKNLVNASRKQKELESKFARSEKQLKEARASMSEKELLSSKIKSSGRKEKAIALELTKSRQQVASFKRELEHVYKEITKRDDLLAEKDLLLEEKEAFLSISSRIQEPFSGQDKLTPQLQSARSQISRLESQMALLTRELKALKESEERRKTDLSRKAQEIELLKARLASSSSSDSTQVRKLLEDISEKERQIEYLQEARQPFSSGAGLSGSADVQKLMQDIEDKDKEIAYLKEVIKNTMEKLELLSGAYSY